MLGEHNSVEIETGASPSEVRLILKNVPGIEMIETQEKDDGVTWGKDHGEERGRYKGTDIYRHLHLRRPRF